MPTDHDIGEEAARWGFHPGHIRNNPLFAWPPLPMAVLLWYRAYWLVISSITLSLVLAALAVWLWSPEVAQTSAVGIGWIATIWLGFLIPHTGPAGGLHL